jgi:hypothetical protein
VSLISIGMLLVALGFLVTSDAHHDSKDDTQ